MSQSSNKPEKISPPIIDPLLKIEDLERIFGVHRRTINRMCQRGELPRPLRIIGRKRWTTTSIQAAIDQLANRKGKEIVTVPKNLIEEV